MSETSPRQTILDKLDWAQRDWDEIVSLGSPDQMQLRLNDTWTFASLTAHLLAWRTYGLARFEAAASGEALPPTPYPESMTDVDEINAYFHERDRYSDGGNAAQEYSASFDQLRRIVQSMPDAALTDPGALPTLNGQSIYDLIASDEFFDHLYGEHAEELAAWRKLTAAK